MLVRYGDDDNVDVDAGDDDTGGAEDGEVQERTVTQGIPGGGER